MKNSPLQKLTLSMVFASSFAIADVSVLYTGTARLLNLSNGQTSTEEVFLRKTLAPESSTITEIACVLRPNEKPKFSQIYMKVEGEKITAISDKTDFTGNLSGTGSLQGEAWNWNFFKFSMSMKFGEHQARIEDVNFVVGNRLIARKQIYFDEVPTQLWEIEMDGVASEVFEKLAEKANCPNF